MVTLPYTFGQSILVGERAVHRGTAPFMAGQQAERRGTHVYMWPSFPYFIFAGFGALRMVPIFRAHISLSIFFFLEMLLQKHLEMYLSIILMTVSPVWLKNHD